MFKKTAEDKLEEYCLNDPAEIKRTIQLCKLAGSWVHAEVGNKAMAKELFQAAGYFAAIEELLAKRLN